MEASPQVAWVSSQDECLLWYLYNVANGRGDQFVTMKQELKQNNEVG